MQANTSRRAWGWLAGALTSLSLDTGGTLTGVGGALEETKAPDCSPAGAGAGPALRTKRLSQGTRPCPQEKG